MIKFISKEVLKLAFSRGIDNFMEIYKLQSNKNYVSETLGNLAINFKSKEAVHTNHIFSSEVEQANRIKAILNRDGELQDFFSRFGKKLKQIAQEKSNQCFITSHYSFITLAIFHYASVIDVLNSNEGYNYYLNMNELTSYYLTPNTRKKEVILNLYNIVGDALSKIDTSVLSDSDKLNQLNIHVSDTEKLWAFLCSDNSPTRVQVESFLDVDTFKKYSNLSKSLLNTKKNNNYEHDLPLGETAKVKIKNAFDNSEILLKKFNKIGNAIAAYNLKFEQNTSSPIAGNNTASQLSAKYSETIMEAPVTQLMTGIGRGSLSCLKTMFPPAFITSLVTELGFKLIEISTESKGYGVINRHGITGQLRSHLLKVYIDMISVFIKNNYYYIFSQGNEADVVKVCKIVIDTVASFFDSYKKAIELLPNKNQNGSLYYYLGMYVESEKTKIDQWNKSKLGSIYK
ncbi:MULTISPECIES: hypothetical protein [Francisella]|uniref:Uncharacterized protein n=1 Tax=Francisella opportunistica TaxID=2016517 RepID=A0A345JTL0_9GAMM|nr:MULTISPECIES: hypothetical protein [Francisella]APC92456.1 hypothetical protein BBG19_1734 [Francisella sp. MA067296]AXH30656.1 hypothetical protein CGC43_08770 [Francisella opportunistica]AXH32299.1 hypothetical protein CGC44_08755 [Francisella opportunistica]AXH33947.1 hypothetical protein CGC45_08810 [Francisella opportunistica]